MIVQISAGQGPSECQLAVAKLFEALKGEYGDLEIISETKGYEKGCLDSVRFRTCAEVRPRERYCGFVKARSVRTIRGKTVM